MLEKTLLSISDADFSGLKISVIIVDNNSCDDTQKVIKSMREYIPIKLNTVIEKRQGLSIARNTGITNSRADYVIFIDDDVLVENNLFIEFK